MNSSPPTCFAAIIRCAGSILLSLVVFGVAEARGQSMAHLTLDPWHERDLAETYDHPMVQAGGHVNGAPSDTQVFAWDSFGRVRLNRDNPDSPFVGYRILTIDA